MLVRRFAILWITYAIIFSFVVGAVFSWSLRLHQQVYEQKQGNTTAKPDQSSKQQDQSKTLWERTYDDPIALYTGMLTLFTAVLAAISGIQIGFLIQADKTARRSAIAATRAAIASTRQTRLVGETAERRLRAYVFIELAFRKSAHVPNPSFSIQIKNFGQTPAKKGSITIDARVDSIEKPSFDETRNKDTVRFQLGPTGQMVLEIDALPITLMPEHMGAFAQKEIAMYIYGVITYIDAFAQTRTTDFRLRYDANCIGTGRLFNCQEGNEYT